MSGDEIQFGTLADAPLREAWAHEAHKFTPWLAENLDRLAYAIGVPLELTGTEMRVGSFSADILARNPIDDSVVLIENQLEGSDHTHLGQIMTYLAGLETHTMIWVAPSFREEHLSAVRWLNEHTVDPFAFFAVRLRVVRIGESPYAPLFEVIERPNEWDRQVAAKRRAVEGEMSELGQHRLAFWTHFCGKHPEHGPPYATSSIWLELSGSDAILVQYLAKNSVGLFVRPPRGVEIGELEAQLSPHIAKLTEQLGAREAGNNGFLASELTIDAHDKSNWDRMSDWLDEKTKRYQTAFQTMLGDDR